jgi:hypothetical protein
MLSRLIPYAEEITEDHQCGFQCKRLYSEAVYQLFIDFKKCYDSVRREVCIIFPLSFVSL